MFGGLAVIHVGADITVGVKGLIAPEGWGVVILSTPQNTKLRGGC